MSNLEAASAVFSGYGSSSGYDSDRKIPKGMNLNDPMMSVFTLDDLRMRVHDNFDGVMNDEGEPMFDEKLNRLRRRFLAPGADYDSEEEEEEKPVVTKQEFEELTAQENIEKLETIADRISSMKDVTRASNMKRAFYTIQMNLMNLDRHLNAEDIGEGVIRGDSAIKIQKIARGFCVRRRFNKMKKALREVRVEQGFVFWNYSRNWIKQRLEFDANIVKFARVVELKRMRPYHKRWLWLANRNQPLRRHLQKRAKEKLREKVRVLMRRWLEVAIGPQNRFIITARFKERWRVAEQAVLDWKEETYWDGQITDGMIKDKYDTMSVEWCQKSIIERRSRKWISFWVGYMRNKVTLRSNILKARIKHREMLKRSVLRRIHRYISYLKRVQGRTYIIRRNKNVKDRRQKFQLAQLIIRRWRKYAHGQVESLRRFQMKTRSLLVKVFVAFKNRILFDRQLRVYTLQRWMEYSRNLRVLPFRAWYLYYLNLKHEKAAEQALLNAALRRRVRRMLQTVFFAWKELAELGHRIEYQRTKQDLIQALDVQSEINQALEDTSRQQAVLIKQFGESLQAEQKRLEEVMVDLKLRVDEVVGLKEENGSTKQELLILQQITKQQEIRMAEMEGSAGQGLEYNDKDLTTWKVYHVRDWLESNGFESLVPNFEEAKISGRELPFLTVDRLKRMQIVDEAILFKLRVSLEVLKMDTENEFFNDIDKTVRDERVCQIIQSRTAPKAETGPVTAQPKTSALAPGIVTVKKVEQVVQEDGTIKEVVVEEELPVDTSLVQEEVDDDMTEFLKSMNFVVEPAPYLHGPGAIISKRDMSYVKRAKWMMTKLPDTSWRAPLDEHECKKQLEDMVDVMRAVATGMYGRLHVDQVDIAKEAHNRMSKLEKDHHFEAKFTEGVIDTAGRTLKWGDLAQGLSVYDKRQRTRKAKMVQRIQATKTKAFRNNRRGHSEKMNVYAVQRGDPVEESDVDVESAASVATTPRDGKDGKEGKDKEPLKPQNTSSTNIKKIEGGARSTSKKNVNILPSITAK